MNLRLKQHRVNKREDQGFLPLEKVFLVTPKAVLTTTHPDARVLYSPASRLPVAAVQPMTGGMAPTTAPTHVLAMLILFMGV